LWDVKTGVVARTISGNNVYRVAYSPDGETLASSCNESDVCLWNAQTGSLISVMKGHEDVVNSILYSTDGMTIASGSRDGTIRLWDKTSGNVIHTFKGHYGSVSSVVFTPDKKHLISGSEDSRLMVWNISDGRQLATLVAFDDGHWFVTTRDGKYDCSGCAANAKNNGMKYVRWLIGNTLLRITELPSAEYRLGILRVLTNNEKEE
jgi:WD40 repeat protein